MKSYIKPVTDIEQLSTASLVAASLDPKIDSGKTEGGGTHPDFANRRGSWGNLWSNED